ncbi:MAG: cell division protein ZapA [Spirochaetaceae bacterium]|jgi:cell division protein ZapA (FtsZ GTPase activity inhibitor)|nr:cell division protein ZapA [Spirochaetaceae bacterium]
MPKSDLRISMLGTSFTISADADPEYLERLLENYRRFVEDTKQSTGLNDPLKAAILSGFLLCDEIEKTRARYDETVSSDGQPGGPGQSGRQPELDRFKIEQLKIEQIKTEQLTLDIIARLDEALGE